MTSGLQTRIPEGANAPFGADVTAGAVPVQNVIGLIAKPTRIDGPQHSGEKLERFLKGQTQMSEDTRGRAIDLRVVLARLEGVSFEEAAALLGTSPKRLAAWLHGAETVPTKKAELLRDLNRIVLDLGRVLDPVALPRWLATPNHKLDGLSPFEALKRRRVAEVLRVVAGYLEPTFG